MALHGKVPHIVRLVSPMTLVAWLSAAPKGRLPAHTFRQLLMPSAKHAPLGSALQRMGRAGSKFAVPCVSACAAYAMCAGCGSRRHTTSCLPHRNRAPAAPAMVCEQC